MALTAREITDGTRANSEEPGRLDTIRLFQVDASPDVARTATNLPILGESLSYDTSQKVTKIDVDWERGSGTTSRVTVRYNKGGSWGGADPLFASWTLSYWRVAVPIPYATEDIRTFRYNAGAAGTKFITSYPVNYINHWESRKRFIRRLRIGHMTPADWEPIGDQNNTLHKIYNRWYLFNIGDLVQIAPLLWDVQYTWEFDSGTSQAQYLENQDIRIAFPIGLSCVNPLMYPGQPYTRPPFHSVWTVPVVTAGVPDFPDFVRVCDYPINPNGWQTLPGMVL